MTALTWGRASISEHPQSMFICSPSLMFMCSFHLSIVPQNVTSWIKAREACKRVGGRLPIFMHGDDEYPGMDLEHFYVLQRAFEQFPFYPEIRYAPLIRAKMPRFNFRFWAKMGDTWKSCFPIGLVYNRNNPSNTGIDKDAFVWINGKPVKNPANYKKKLDSLYDALKDNFWSSDVYPQPTNEFEAGSGRMEFGYLIGKEIKFRTNQAKGYFNDYNTPSISKKQMIGQMIAFHCKDDEQNKCENYDFMEKMGLNSKNTKRRKKRDASNSLGLEEGFYFMNHCNKTLTGAEYCVPCKPGRILCQKYIPKEKRNQKSADAADLGLDDLYYEEEVIPYIIYNVSSAPPTTQTTATPKKDNSSVTTTILIAMGMLILISMLIIYWCTRDHKKGKGAKRPEDE